MVLPLSFHAAWLLLGVIACAANRSADAPGSEEDRQETARRRMVTEQIEARGVRDEAVLRAMREVPRHVFVPAAHADEAYDDTPLPIGHGQTISQPYIVGLMTELARPRPTDKVLEVGTGCGYQAAVLSRVVRHVFSVEIVEALGQEARARLQKLGYANVTTRIGNGYEGWPEEAPFDVILVTAAPEEIPQALVDQLKPGGRLVIPVGPMAWQELKVVEKDGEGRLRMRVVAPVRFVPMIRK